MAAIKQGIPFLPDNSSWEDWNGNMILYFGEEPLPYLPEVQWKDFARAMITLSTFSPFSLPSPDKYLDWQDWVRETVTAINGPTQ